MQCKNELFEEIITFEEKFVAEMLRETGSKYELAGMDAFDSIGQNTPENTFPCPNTGMLIQCQKI